MSKSIRRVFSNVWQIIRLPEMTMLPGQLAFFFVLSVVPTISLFTYGASLLNLSTDFIFNFVRQAFSSEIAELIFLPASSGTSVGIGFVISLIIALYIASNGADSIIKCSNNIYGISNHGYIRRRIKAVIMTFFIVSLFLFILVVPIFGNRIIEIIKGLNLSASATVNVEIIFTILRGPISWFIMFMFIKILYTMAPDRRIRSSYVNGGALFTTILWTVITYVYSFWITNFSNYNAFYGGLTNIVILMLWIYFLAYVFVVGMSLNYKEEVMAKTGNIKASKK